MQMRCVFLLSALLLCSAGSAIAATITYDGSSPPYTGNVPGYFGTNKVIPRDASDNLLPANNTVTVNYSTGDDPDGVFGGYSNSGATVTGNKVFIKGTSASGVGSVYGGFVHSSGSVNGNEVTMEAGKVENIFGGFSSTQGGASGNKVFFKGGTAEVNGSFAEVTAGSGNNALAKGNELHITGGKIAGNAHGGIGKTVEGNKVVMSKGSVWTIFGGKSEFSDGAATDNTVTITGGEVKHEMSGMGSDVYGGWAANGTAKNNTVTVDGGNVIGGVRGGSAGTGGAVGISVEKNTVIIKKGTVTGSIRGGYGIGAKVDKNEVEVLDGTLQDVSGAFSQGNAIQAGGAKGNIVTIRGGTMRYVRGAESTNSNFAEEVSGNIVNIHGGTMETVYAAVASHADSVIKNNTVNLYGGTINGFLMGAVSSATPNAISGVGSGNTLNVYTSGQTLKLLGGFQKYNFYLPSNTKHKDVILTVTGDTGVPELKFKVPLKGVPVSVGLQNGKDNVLEKGDKVTLIDSTEGFDSNTPTTGSGLKGVATTYAFKVSVEKGTGAQQLLVATVAEAPDKDDGGKGDDGDKDDGGSKDVGKLNPRVKSILEGALGSFALVGQGSEMVAGPGMRSAVNAAKATAATGAGGPIAFGTLGGGFSRYNTGSHIKVESVNFLAGLGWNFNLNEGKNGSLLTGLFFETGFGGYDSHNSFSNASSVHGTGDTRYFGGGLMGRYTLPVGFYAEGSIRAGKVKNEYKAKDLYSGSGEKAEYDASAAYFGAHGGLGYLWQFSEATSLDTYTQYIWTHQNSDNVNISGDKFHLNEVNSHRWRTGTRLTHEVELRNGVVTSPYIGAAFDYEFGGRQKGNVRTGSGKRWKIDAPTLKGGTGMGEFGLTIKPAATSPVSFGMAVQGYAGKREGVSGNLNFKYEF